MESHSSVNNAGTLLKATDWSKTPLGRMETWPRSLLSYVSMIIEMPSPAIIFWGEDQTQIYNDGYALIMGPRHPRYFGLPYRECWPDTYPLIYPWMRNVLDRGQVVEVEKERILVTRYGFEEEAYFTFTFSPLRNDAGDIAGILQPVFEVTDSVLSERRAETLRALSPDAQSLDPVAHALAAFAANPHDIPAARIYLWSAPEERLVLAGSTPALVWPNSQDDRIERVVQEVFRSNSRRLVDGVAALLLPIEGAGANDPQGVLALALSPRLHLDQKYSQFLQMLPKQLAAGLQRANALQSLERQRTYLNDLFMQAPAGIAVTDGPEHVFELVNPLYRTMIGSRDVVGMPLRKALPELEGQSFHEILDAVYATGEPYVGRELPAVVSRAESGAPEELFFNFVYQPLRDGQHRTSGILILCYEVTEQVRSRQQAEALTEALRREDQRKDEFLAMLAHELRNPLAPISAGAEVLLRGPLDEQRVRRMSEIIARQVRHLTALVDDLLDVSRVTRGLVTIDRHTEDLKSVVIDAVEQVRPLIDARGHRLVTHVTAQSVFVSGDRKRLVQILTNLLNNAAKYTPNGGEIVVCMQAAADEIVVEVQDDGIGIPAELLPRVFELFVQAERSADRTLGGLGIGLALVKSLVELHGGTISCASEGAGRGSQFRLRLPRLRDQADGNATPMPRVQATLQK